MLEYIIISQPFEMHVSQRKAYITSGATLSYINLKIRIVVYFKIDRYEKLRRCLSTVRVNKSSFSEPSKNIKQ